MRKGPLDGEEALLSRLPEPAQARVRAVLAAASSPASDDERRAPPEMPAQLAAVTAHAGRLHVPALSLRTRIAVVGLAAALASTGGLAAAGALPDPAQAVVQDVLGRVGIRVPGPNPAAGNHPFQRGKSGKQKKNVPGLSDVVSTPSGAESPASGPGRGRGNGLKTNTTGGS